jgi:FKBP-type peptidyl-prolyl cis-trans isomerase
MRSRWTIRLAALAAACGLGLPALADDPTKGDPAKFPPLDAKEWKKLDNGMKIWDVKEGKGTEVKKGATVTIHYTGWLTDGTKFDSSRDRDEPATFPLKGLIKGWQEGVPGMKIGGVRRMVIPYNLAYGERGRPPVIPEKATLVFTIEVLETKNP